MRDIGRFAKGGLGVWRIPEVAFEIDDAGRFDKRFINVLRSEFNASAQKCRHRSFAVRRYMHEAASGRRSCGCRGGWKGDAGCLDIVMECSTRLVVTHLAYKGGLAAKTCNPHHRVGGGPAGHNCRWTHRSVKPRRCLMVDQ